MPRHQCNDSVWFKLTNININSSIASISLLVSILCVSEWYESIVSAFNIVFSFISYFQFHILWACYKKSWLHTISFQLLQTPAIALRENNDAFNKHSLPMSSGRPRIIFIAISLVFMYHRDFKPIHHLSLRWSWG